MINFISLGQFYQIIEILNRKEPYATNDALGILTCLSLGVGDICYLTTKRGFSFANVEQVRQIAELCPDIKNVDKVLPGKFNTHKNDAKIIRLKELYSYLSELKSSALCEMNLQYQCQNIEIGYISRLVLEINKLENTLIPIADVFMFIRCSLGLTPAEFSQTFTKYLNRFNI